MAKIGVCKDCSDRHLACHDHCSKYLSERDSLDKRKAEILKTKSKEDAYYLYIKNKRNRGRQR